MITVGRILAAIRREKEYQQSMLHKAVGHLTGIGAIRDAEAGRNPYIEPKLLAAWMEWLELTPMECEFLVQENVRCLVRSQLSANKALKVRPQLLAAISDLVALLTRGKPVEVTKITAELTRHNLPHLLIRPPYIDATIARINKESND